MNFQGLNTYKPW